MTDERTAREAPLAARAASLPSRDDELLRAARYAGEEYNAAILGEDQSAADAAALTYMAVIWKMNGGTNFGCIGGPDAPGYRVRDFCAQTPGLPGMWGQASEQLVEVDGVRAVLKSDGRIGSYCIGHSWHAVDLDKPFFSSTGFLSSMSLPIIWGATHEQAAAIWMREVIKNERKLVQIPQDAFIRTRPREFPWIDAPPAVQVKAASYDQGDYVPFF